MVTFVRGPIEIKEQIVMDYKKEIEDLLVGFNAYKKEIAVLKKVGGEYLQLESKIQFMEFCFSLLEKYQKELILTICINGVSVRKYSDNSGFSRTFISREKQKIIDEINKYFKIKYDNQG